MTNEHDEFDSPVGGYRYTRENVPFQDDYRPDEGRRNYHEDDSYPGGPRKKGLFQRAWTRVLAVVLAAAVIGGACGYGGAALYRSTRTQHTAITQSTRDAVEVSLKTVDGSTVMTPSEVYAATVNSAVSINSSSVGTNAFGQPVQAASSGSGFIITSDGYIVTNHHVVKGATSVSVTLYNGQTYPATVVGGDSDYDVAVLKIEASGLQTVTFGKSADLNVGDTILAIGNPLGELTFSMSKGIVSCCDRAINVDGTPFKMIQVDCSVNPGNSGGALMNLYGEVVGIVSAKYSSYASTTVEGLGFAIPIDDVETIIADIMENGQVTNKAYMAITAGTMTESMAAQYRIDLTQGVFVFSTVKGGAGEKAGLKLGDVITKLNDTEITSMVDLSSAKKGFKAGDTVTLTVYRDGEYITLPLTFDAQPETTGSEEEEIPQSQPNQGQQMPDDWEDFFNYFFGGRGGYGGWGN